MSVSEGALELAAQYVLTSWSLANSGDLIAAREMMNCVPKDLLKAAKREAHRIKTELKTNEQR